MSWQLVTSDEDLARIVTAARATPGVAIDTEFMRRNTFFPQVALVQLCFDGEAWLVDPLAIDDPEPLRELFRDPAVVKVMHSASEDLEVFQRWLGVLPRPLFDTQRAAALLDRGFGIGYRALVHAICGVDLPKGETRSDWLQRPLTESQCEYAAMDVTYLLPVWRELDAACAAQDKRDWVLADGDDAIQGLASGQGNYHRRIKTAWKLNPRQLAALAAICNWREETARRRDKPRSWIIDDKVCLTLAQDDPGSRNALQGLDIPPPALRRYGDEWLELLAAQRELPRAELPAALPGPLSSQQRDQVKRLKLATRDIATELGSAPEVLLAARDYETLLREAAGERVDIPPSWLGWREVEVVNPLRELLQGEGT